jgi:3-oxoacyl-(acyl-carrier-protein) synthase
MQTKIDRTFPILRAAAIRNGSMSLLPTGQNTQIGELRGADVLADVALRACVPLLIGISDGDRDRTGLVIGTGFGCLETDRVFDQSRRDNGGRYASPAAFSRTLPSTVAAELALKLCLRGPSLVVSRGSASAAVALRRAASWMVHLDFEYCIAGGMEWTREAGCMAGLLLLAKTGAGVGTLKVAGEWRRGDESLERLMEWIGGASQILTGLGVELTAATHG